MRLKPPRRLRYSTSIESRVPIAMNSHPHVFEVTDENFEQSVLDVSHRTPVLVDFWAEWCQPCKQLFPILNKLVEEYAGQFVIGKLNIDEQPALATEAGVRSVPMVLVFRKGVVTDQFLGLQPETAVRQIVERNLFRESDRLMDEAREHFHAGEVEKAVEMGRQALADNTGSNEIRFELAQFLLAASRFDEAQALLAEAPREVRDSADSEALLSRIDMARAASEAPSREELDARIAADPGDSAARYQLAGRHVARSEFEPALELLLAILQRDRSFGDDAARRGMIAIFSMLEEDSPLLHRYRTRLFNALH